MNEYWLIAILCLHFSILSLSLGVRSTVPQHEEEPEWYAQASKPLLPKIISKLLPPKLPDLQLVEKPKVSKKYEDYLQKRKAEKQRRLEEHRARLIEEEGFVLKNGTYTIDNNVLREHQEDVEEANKAEKIANIDLVEGLNLMAEKNETLDDVIDDVLFPDRTIDKYTIN